MPLSITVNFQSRLGRSFESNPNQMPPLLASTTLKGPSSPLIWKLTLMANPPSPCVQRAGELAFNDVAANHLARPLCIEMVISRTENTYTEQVATWSRCRFPRSKHAQLPQEHFHLQNALAH